MNAFRRLVFTALIAGLVTGGLISLAYYFGAAPIIARAEVFEQAAAGPAPAHSHGDAAAPHSHDATERAPQDGIERTAYTVLANMVTAVAFSLLLVAVLELWGGNVNWRSGLLWGLGGFAAFTLAPSLGLPPELPGTAVAPLAMRQVWWSATVVATVGGLALLLLQRRPVWLAAGVVLLVAPHLHGAPHPVEFSSTAPESLTREFILVATLTSLLFWGILGTLTGLVFKAMARRSPQPAPTGALSQGS